MKVIKCDRCSADLSNEKYYEIGDIEFHSPNSSAMRVHFEGEDELHSNHESWVTYKNLHFCEMCFDKENFKNYLPKMS